MRERVEGVLPWVLKFLIIFFELQNFKHMKNVTMLVVLLTIIISACSSDDATQLTSFDGTLQSIEDFYGKRAVDSIKKLGIAINTGNTPPNVEGVFEAVPFVLEASLFKNDNIGSIFTANKVTLSNQNNNALTINYKGLQSGNSSSTTQASYISGNGNKFSIFTKIEYTETGLTPSLAATIISGEIKPEGIADYQEIFLMLDNKGQSALIRNYFGRLFKDGDNLASKETSPQVEQKNMQGKALEKGSALSAYKTKILTYFKH